MPAAPPRPVVAGIPFRPGQDGSADRGWQAPGEMVSAGRHLLSGARRRGVGDPRDAECRAALVRTICKTTSPGTPERAALIRSMAASVALFDVKRGHRKVSERSLRKWVALWETHGISGLMRRAPCNAGLRRTHLSFRWDWSMQAAGNSEWRIEEVADVIRSSIRVAWGLTGGGWRAVQLAIFPVVAALTKAAGVPLGECSDELCLVPRRVIELECAALRLPAYHLVAPPRLTFPRPSRRPAVRDRFHPCERCLRVPSQPV
jgi:hypothetical protein